MSNEYWLKEVFGSEEPAQLLKEINEATDKLARISGEIKGTRETIMEDTLGRYANISGTDAEKYIGQWAGSDYAVSVVLGEASHDVISCAGAMDGVRRALSNLFVVIGQKVVALDQRVKAQERRVKEHATANPSIREEVYASTGGLCFYCETQLIDASAGPVEGLDQDRMFHVDHIVPKAHGGPDHITNYVPACSKCNSAKTDRPFVQFVKRRSVKLRVINGWPKEGEDDAANF